jgi:UDP-GlcNAc3NAcA epimerase
MTHPTKRIATVLGARPQFIKASVVSRALVHARRELGHTIDEFIIHTGQHYSPGMSDVFFETLDIPQPKYHLGIGSGSHGQQTGRMLEAIEAVLDAERPDMVLIYGDTNSTVAAALAAAKLHIPIAHVEAGLRSFNRRMPEEINRVVSDQLSTLLFAPTETAVQNLAAEGIVKGVHKIGDVMLDAAIYFSSKARSIRNGCTPYRYMVATIHRAENTDDRSRFLSVLSALVTVAECIGLPIIFPTHPRTRQRLEHWNIPLPECIDLIDPVDYLEMIALIRDSAMVLTDSGGVQKEAFFLQRPCITLRDETEWVETVALGWNTVVGVDASAAAAAAMRYLANPPTPPGHNPFGDGMASKRIVDVLVHFQPH